MNRGRGLIIKSETDLSYQFRILSVLAISFVVLGHLNFYARGFIDTSFTEPMTFSGWFPYYSFHLPVFLFISGYYFKSNFKASPGQAGIVVNDNGAASKKQAVKGAVRAFALFAAKKARRLLLPYYIISGISLFVGSVISEYGFTFAQTFSFYRWLIAPWTRPYIITFSVPAWYLAALFIAEMIFFVLHGLKSRFIKNEKAAEISLLIFTLAAGILAVYIKNTSHASPAATVYLRSVVMLFFMQTGFVYRKYLERRDTLSSVWYFLIVFAVQYVIIYMSGNASLSPGLFDLSGFSTLGLEYFAGGLTGIMLWLRISRLLSCIRGKNGQQSRIIDFIGSNTKYIMAFHVFGWFLLNLGLDALRNSGSSMVIAEGFSSSWFHSFLYYACIQNPRMIILYYAAGMGFSLAAAWVIGIFARLYKNRGRT